MDSGEERVNWDQVDEFNFDYYLGKSSQINYFPEIGERALNPTT